MVRKTHTFMADIWDKPMLHWKLEYFAYALPLLIPHPAFYSMAAVIWWSRCIHHRDSRPGMIPAYLLYWVLLNYKIIIITIYIFKLTEVCIGAGHGDPECNWAWLHYPFALTPMRGRLLGPLWPPWGTGWYWTQKSGQIEELICSLLVVVQGRRPSLGYRYVK